MAVFRRPGKVVLSSANLSVCRLHDQLSISSNKLSDLTNKSSVCIPISRKYSTSNFRRNSSLGYSRSSLAKLCDVTPRSFARHGISGWRGYQTIEWRRNVHAEPKVNLKWLPGTTPHIESFGKGFKPNELEDKLFDYLCEPDEKLLISKFKSAIAHTGLRETDPRLQECMRNFSLLPDAVNLHNTGVDRETFKKCIAPNSVLISHVFKNDFIIPDFQQFTDTIDKLYWKARDNINGKVATYIPQLARYSPNIWAVSVCSVDGQRYSVGDVNVPLCLQSMSKPLTYAMALDELSPDVVHQYVGQEPSGVSFNEIALDYRDKPHNPMVNAGAIVVCSLLKQALNLADRFDYVTEVLKHAAGGEYLSFNNSVFLSERETADRNFALAYYMREKKCFPKGADLTEIMDFYFQMCSIEVTTESASVIAATLANGGICPITGDKIFSASSVRDTLSLMLSCGMYDYSGEFAFTVGLPAKSGVSGGIMVVIPNKMGFCVWSPALDKWGNSVRGVQFIKELVSQFNFHHYDNLKFTPQKIDPCRRKVESRAYEVVKLLFSAFNGDVSSLRRLALSYVNMNQCDYDGRTALHVGAAEGNADVVYFLVHKCNCDLFAKDRWGFQPIDDARRFKHDVVVEILEAAMKEKAGDVDNVTEHDEQTSDKEQEKVD